jgi:hypothetical protein
MHLQAKKFGIIFDKGLWKNKSIEICWGTPRFVAENSALMQEMQFSSFESKFLIKPKRKDIKEIRQIIESEYNKDNIGVEFVGWNKCRLREMNNNTLVLLTINNEADYEGIANIGSSTINLQDPSGTLTRIGFSNLLNEEKYHNSSELVFRPMTVSFVSVTAPHVLKQSFQISLGHLSRTLNFNNYLRFLALHEFGHTLGLMHEHIHPDSPQAESQTCSDLGDRINAHQSSFYFSQYDHESIMNYCFSEENSAFLARLIRLKFISKLPDREKLETVKLMGQELGEQIQRSQYYINWNEFPEYANLLGIRPGKLLKISTGDLNLLRKFYQE